MADDLEHKLQEKIKLKQAKKDVRLRNNIQWITPFLIGRR